MLVGGCCCNQPDYWIYVGVYYPGTYIYRINPVTGTFTVWSNLPAACITVDPTTGYVYTCQWFGLTSNPPARYMYKIHCLTSTGVIVWTLTKTNQAHPLPTLAACNDGHLYVAEPFNASGVGVLRKYNSLTGVEITSGNWPYTAGAGITYLPVACDKSGNIYVGGNNTDFSVKVTKFNSSGVVQWTSNASNVGDPALNDGGVTSIAVNNANTEITVARVYSNFLPGIDVRLNARISSGGGVVSSWRDGTEFDSNWGQTSSVAYNTTTGYYSISRYNASGTPNQLWKFAGTHYTLVSGDDMANITNIIVGKDNKEFLFGAGATAPFGYGRVKNVTNNWVTGKMSNAFPLINNPNSMATSDGLIGAFA